MRFRIAALALLLPLAPALAACEDPFGGREPILFSDTLTLTAPGAAAAQTGSAINLQSGNQVIFPERIGDVFPDPSWDVALRLSGGQLTLLPLPSTEFRVGARITQARTLDFARADEAPENRSEYGEAPVVLEEGRVYFVRSRAFVQFGLRCVAYAKIQPLELRPAAGTARLAVVSNSACNDRRLTD